jgi:putative spermidine/putrescine transport system permease protein
MSKLAVKVAAALGLAFLLIPLLIIIAVSVTETEYLAFPPVGFTLRWYAAFLSDAEYITPLMTSGVLALLSTVVALILGVPAALALERSRLNGRRLLSALFLSPLILPGIVVGAGVLQLASQIGWSRSFMALLVGHVAIITPYIVRTTLASLADIGPSTEEAARDLGATATEAFFYVTLPTIKPGVIAGALFAAIISWVNVEVSIFNTTADLMTLPVKLFNDVQFQLGPIISAVSAATIFLAVIIVVVVDLAFGLDRFAVGDR